MKDRAYAKINLCLDVVGNRDDGYHELNMIMVPIDFYDVLEMNISKFLAMKQRKKHLKLLIIFLLDNIFLIDNKCAKIK